MRAVIPNRTAKPPGGVSGRAYGEGGQTVDVPSSGILHIRMKDGTYNDIDLSHVRIFPYADNDGGGLGRYWVRTAFSFPRLQPLGNLTGPPHFFSWGFLEQDRK